MKEWIQPEFNKMFDEILDDMNKIQDTQYKIDNKDFGIDETIINIEEINQARRRIIKVFEDMEKEILELYKETKRGDYNLDSIRKSQEIEKGGGNL